jgi:rare lipoprotein A (peptidoglycan hydrolase)
LRRFRWKRRRAALALLPAAAMMTTMGVAGAAVGINAMPVKPSVKLEAKRHVRAGETALIKGRVTPAESRTVVMKVGDRKVETIHTRNDGGFRARWRAPRAGTYTVKAVVRGVEPSAPSASDSVRINVYRSAAASYYGPGLYGGSLACGGTLRPGTMGVANRSLPCGSRLTLRYGNRSVRVQVIDRGPFSGGREFDLTAATRARLGFPSTGTVLSTR